MKFDLEKIVLEQVQYKSGYDNKDDKYVISASMVDKDPLQNYLTILYGSHSSERITDAELGSVFHLGMEQIVSKTIPKGAKLLSEHSMHMELPNGWILSGTADLVVHNADMTSSIHDYKLTKSYALKMINKNPQVHSYGVQLQVLDMLHSKEFEVGPSDIFIEVFLKDAKAIEKEKTYNRVQIAPAGYKALEAHIVTITDSLQKHIEEGSIPEKCPDVWERKLKNGTTISTKCALYCSHGAANVCPYYKADTRESVARLTNW